MPAGGRQKVHGSPPRCYGPGMDLVAFLDEYINKIYLARNAQAARRFIADIPSGEADHRGVCVRSQEDRPGTGFPPVEPNRRRT